MTANTNTTNGNGEVKLTDLYEVKTIGKGKNAYEIWLPNGMKQVDFTSFRTLAFKLSDNYKELFDNWIAVGYHLRTVKHALGDDNQRFGAFLNGAAQNGILPALGKDNRSSIIWIVDAIDDGFGIEGVDLTFNDWKATHAPRKSSPDTIKRAFTAWNTKRVRALETDDEKEKREKEAQDAKGKKDAKNDKNKTGENVDLKNIDNGGLFKAFNLLQVEMIARLNSDKYKKDEARDISRVIDSLAMVFADFIEK